MTTASGSNTLTRSENIPLGIGLMVLGMFLFSVNDVIGKWLAATYTVGQILLFRSLAASVVLVPVVRRKGVAELTRLPRPLLQALRVFFAVAETACFYAAVAMLPLADAITYYLAGPIYVTVLAAFLLGEHVGWRRWAAVLIGFVGVVLALQPSASVFGWHAIIALVGSFLYALLMITTRVLRGTPDLNLTAWQIFGGLLFGVLAAPIGWVPFVRVTDVLLLGFLGVVALIAIYCVNRSLILAPASAVVPYQYTLIVWGVLFGYLAFGDVPDPLTVVGGIIIVGAGLFIFFREQRVGRVHKEDVVTGP
ncbi:DMT family transporter [Bauldia sp.]|uniref:DMT family transporter n=1 Tax=Bauldia sp. TaxID=2575872 RepID=UPI003BAA46DE